MKLMGIAGWSGSGKTTLIVQLLPALIARGLQVSTLKHAHHNFDVDKPGKDSFEHRAAGATEVMVSSANRWALMREHRREPVPNVEDLLARMAPVDLVLIEGFKAHAHDKIEVIRHGAHGTPLWRQDPRVVAVAVDDSLPGRDRADIGPPVLDVNDIAAVARFILGHCGLAGRD